MTTPPQLSVTVSDDRGASTTVGPVTIDVASAASGSQPQFTSTPTGPAVVGQPYQYQVTVTTSQGAVPVFSLTGQENTQSFQLPVTENNETPTISSSPVTTAIVGQAYQYQVVAGDTDGDPLTYSLARPSSGGPPAGMLISSASGLLTWTPSAVDIGNQPVTIVVDDGHGAQTSETFTLHVLPGNQPPTITSTPPGPATVGEPYQYQVLAGDPDGDPITYSISATPDAMNITSSGLVTFTPGAATIETVTITASDGRRGTATQSFSLTVQAAAGATDDPPRITSNWPQQAVLNQLWEYRVVANDPDGDPVTLSVSSSSSSIEFDPSDPTLLECTPSSSDGSSIHVVITASDGRPGGTDTQTFDLPVVATAPGHLPVFTSTPPGPATVGDEYEYRVAAEDPDGTPITYSVSSDAASPVAFDPSDPTLLEWTPGASDGASVSITVTATDPAGATLQTFTLDSAGDQPGESARPGGGRPAVPGANHGHRLQRRPGGVSAQLRPGGHGHRPEHGTHHLAAHR